MFPPADVSVEAIRAQLEKILASPGLAHSARLKHFLRFAVERVLTGQPDTLKEYVLGTEVFNRKSSFDPHSDPIVRVEAGRLRRKLEEYYRTEGRNDLVLIEFPRGSYAPLFRKRQPSVSRTARIWSWIPFSHGWKVATGITAGLLLIGSMTYWLAGSFGRKLSVASLLGGNKPPVPPSGQAGSPSLAEPPSLVVLPFASANKDEEYFSDGLTEELMAALAKVEGLKVVSRTSAFHFKGKMEDVRQIGAQLNVNLVLEGSVRKTGDKLRIIAQLVKVADGFRLWSATYDRKLKEVFVIQEEIAGAVAAALKIELGRTNRAPPSRTTYPNLDAHDQYLKGLHFARQWAENGIRKGIEHFQQATQIDPSYAAAYAELAECYALLGAHAALAPNEVMPKAKAAAQKALAIDPSLADAHVALGLVKSLYDWDWEGAEQEFKRALELDPDDADAYEAHVRAYLTPMGRLDEALQESQRAHSLDMVSPRIHSVLGLTYYHRREYDQAIAQYQEALELDPQFSAAYLALGSAYEQKSMFGEAVAALQKGKATWTGGLGESLLGYTDARMGKKDEARSLLNELKQQSQQRYVSAAHVAIIHIGLHEKDQALDWLEKAYKEHSPALVYLKINPRYDSLRSHPRFLALLKELQLD